MAVMPTEKGRSERDGIVFNQLTYISAKHIEGSLYNHKNLREVCASFDHKDTNQIWLHNTDGSYEACRLHPKDLAFANQTFDDVKRAKAQAKATAAKKHAERSVEAYRTAGAIQEIVKKSKAYSGSNLRPKSLSEAKETRAREAANNIEKDRFRNARMDQL
jgi:hypothetical protein